MNTAKIANCEITPDIDYTGGNFIVILGSSYSGKTHWLSHLFLRIGKNFQYGLVFCSTLGLNNSYTWIPAENKTRFWKDFFLPNGRKVKGFESMLRDLMVHQQKNIELLGRDRAPNIFVIVEDPMGKVDFHHSDMWNEIAGQIRHFKITLFIIVQYIKYVSPAMRNGAHRFVLFGNTEDDLVKAKQLVIGFVSKMDWLRFIIQETQDYGGVMYDRLTRTFHCFRAPQTEPKFYLQFF
jgi:hypothetical protein